MLMRIFLGVALLFGALLYFFSSSEEASSPPPPQAEKRILPTFDTVRVDRDGSAVLAGGAAPFVLVELLLGEKILNSTYSSRKGHWVIVLDEPLRLSEPTYLRLRVKEKEGATYFSEEVIIIGLLQKNRKPHIVLVGSEKASEVLQAGALLSKYSNLLLHTIDYDDKGKVVLSGRAQAGSIVQLYYDNKFIQQTFTDPNEKWRMETTRIQKAGSLRLDMLSAQEKKVIARIEIPFQMEKNLNQAGEQIIIEVGDNLWKIARRIYGRGDLYTIIYKQNQNRIKNPDLIYPGQVFDAPPEVQ